MSEKEESEQLKEWIGLRKIQCFDLLRILVQGNMKLEGTGYKDLSEACSDSITRAAREIESKIRAHERKWR